MAIVIMTEWKEKYIWCLWLKSGTSFSAEPASRGIFQGLVKVELTSDGSHGWASLLASFSLSCCSMETMETRTPGWKLIETSAGLSKAFGAEVLRWSRGLRKWLTPTPNGFDFIQSLTRPHCRMYSIKRWRVRSIPYEPHSWMKTYYAWPGRNRVSCHIQATEVNENKVWQRSGDNRKYGLCWFQGFAVSLISLPHEEFTPLKWCFLYMTYFDSKLQISSHREDALKIFSTVAFRAAKAFEKAHAFYEELCS